jgi:hypothetical protein
MDVRDAKPGDYIDVRMIVVAVTDAGAIVRLAERRAVHQFEIGSHQIQNAEARSAKAIAADVVCSSYDGHAPLTQT